jgi:hypothetical protein
MSAFINEAVRTKLRLRFEAKLEQAAFDVLCKRIQQSGRVLFRLIDELQHDPKKMTLDVGKLPLIESTTLDRYAPWASKLVRAVRTGP